MPINKMTMSPYPALRGVSGAGLNGANHRSDRHCGSRVSGDALVSFGRTPGRNSRIPAFLLGALAALAPSSLFSADETKAQKISQDSVVLQVAPEDDPLLKYTREQRNRMACEDDGVRFPEITPLDTSFLAEYQEYRTGQIKMIRGNMLDPQAPVEPADYDEKKFGTSFGTAWFCTTDGTMITNYHVTKRAQKNFDGTIEVVLADDRRYSAEILFESPERDLAYIRLLDENGKPFPKKTFPSFHLVPDSQQVKKGRYAALTGNHKGYLFTFVDGKVSHTQRWDKEYAVPLFQYFVTTEKGSSGSAVTLANGQVFALHNSGLRTKADMNFGIDINNVADAMAVYREGLPVQSFRIAHLSYDEVPFSDQLEHIRGLEREWYHTRQAVAQIERELKHLREKLIPHALESQVDDMEQLEEDYKERLKEAKKRVEESLKAYEEKKSGYEAPLANVGSQTVTGGVIVQEVTPGGMAEALGLKTADVITHLDGEAVDPQTYARGTRSQFIYHNPTITYLRGGKIYHVKVSDEVIQKFLINEAGPPEEEKEKQKVSDDPPEAPPGCKD